MKKKNQFSCWYKCFNNLFLSFNRTTVPVWSLNDWFLIRVLIILYILLFVLEALRWGLSFLLSWTFEATEACAFDLHSCCHVFAQVASLLSDCCAPVLFCLYRWGQRGKTHRAVSSWRGFYFQTVCGRHTSVYLILTRDLVVDAQEKEKSGEVQSIHREALERPLMVAWWCFGRPSWEDLRVSLCPVYMWRFAESSVHKCLKKNVYFT